MWRGGAGRQRGLRPRGVLTAQGAGDQGCNGPHRPVPSASMPAAREVSIASVMGEQPGKGALTGFYLLLDFKDLSFLPASHLPFLSPPPSLSLAFCDNENHPQSPCCSPGPVPSAFQIDHHVFVLEKVPAAFQPGWAPQGPRRGEVVDVITQLGFCCQWQRRLGGSRRIALLPSIAAQGGWTRPSEDQPLK